MRHEVKIILTITIGLMLISCLTLINIDTKSEVKAASNSSTSDLQLMARAINGEARGEPYEGQVAVRSSNIKQSKKPKLPKHNSRSYI